MALNIKCKQINALKTKAKHLKYTKHWNKFKVQQNRFNSINDLIKINIFISYKTKLNFTQRRWIYFHNRNSTWYILKYVPKIFNASYELYIKYIQIFLELFLYRNNRNGSTLKTTDNACLYSLLLCWLSRWSSALVDSIIGFIPTKKKSIQNNAALYLIFWTAASVFGEFNRLLVLDGRLECT